MVEEGRPDHRGSCWPCADLHSSGMHPSAMDRVTFQTLPRVWKNDRSLGHGCRDGASGEVVEYGPSMHVNSLVSTPPSIPQRCAEAESPSLTFHPTVHTLTRMSPSEPLGQPILWAGWVAPTLSFPAPGRSVLRAGTSGGPGIPSVRAPKVRSASQPSNSAP